MTYKKDMEKYLITGASGQLGHALQLAFGGEDGNAMARPHEALDITDTTQVSKWLPVAKPDVVINCAAYTNVPQAEKDREQCWRVNALGVDNLARICSEKDIPFFHISTDFVFGQDFARCAMAKLDPRKPVLDPEAARRAQAAYTEDCPVGPVGYYALSKAAGEHAVLAAGPVDQRQSEARPHRRVDLRQRHAIARVSRARHHGRHSRAVDVQRGGVSGAFVAVHPRFDYRIDAAPLAQESTGLRVRSDDAGEAAELGCHVGERGALVGRQLRDRFAAKGYEAVIPFVLYKKPF